MYGGYNNAGGFGGFGGLGGDGQAGGGYLGGFFASPQKNAAGGFNSPQGGARAPSTRDQQGLMAVTVKMVTEAVSSESGEGNTVRFHNGQEASLVELVGQVELVDDSEQMFAKYVIDDGTGRVVCKKFIDADKAGMPRVSVGKFVRVVGPFRRFGAESYLNAHKVEEIQNLDEISRHRIEVIHTMLQLNGHMDDSGAVSGIHASMSSVPSDLPPMYHENVNTANRGFPSGHVGSNEWFLGEVQRVFGPRGPKYNPSSGVSRQQLQLHFVSSLTAKQVDEKIVFLHDEGHLFSTIDDNHFQLTHC